MKRVVVVSFVLTLVGCPCGPKPPARRDAGVTATPTAPAREEFRVPEGTTAGTTVDDPRFSIATRLVDEGRYPLGRQSSFEIEVLAKEGTTMRRDRPAHVELRAPAVAGLSTSRAERATAPVNTDSRILFEVPFLPMQAGEALVDAVVHFPVCVADACEDRVEHLHFALDVR